MDYLRMERLFGNGSLTGDIEGIVEGRVGFTLPAYGTVITKRPPPLTR
jgi:hypothetical protein